MNLAVLKTAGSRALHGGIFLVKKYSPEILTAVGVVGTGVAAVMAAKATLKLEPIVDDIQNSIQTIEEIAEETGDNSDEAKDKAFVYGRGAIKIVRLYTPAGTVFLISAASILAAHGILRRRLASVTAAYGLLERLYSDYRARVAEELGEEKEKELHSGYRVVEEINEKGKKVKSLVKPASSYSQYAFWFDENARQWEPIPELNLMTLKHTEHHFTNRLRLRGYVTLNEVHDFLGVPPTDTGAICGWILGRGDDYVDLGFLDPSSDRARAFVNGEENVVLLDPNVTGMIWEDIPRVARILGR
jgi:hypothetical protein